MSQPGNSSNGGTAVARVQESARALRAFLEAPTITQRLVKVLPKGLTPQRIVQQTLTLAYKNQELLECTQTSILLGIIQAAELGLELSGPLGHAYLIPRRNKRLGCKEATFQTGYRGLVNLAFRSGEIIAFPVRTVHAHDRFHVEYGSFQRLEHVPNLVEDRGEPIGYYAVVSFRSGGHDFEFMSHAEAVAFRKRYCGGNPVWDSEFEEMAKKTCVRALCKRLPLCVQAQQAATTDEHGERGVSGVSLPPGAEALLEPAPEDPFPEALPDPEPTPAS